MLGYKENVLFLTLLTWVPALYLTQETDLELHLSGTTLAKVSFPGRSYNTIEPSKHHQPMAIKPVRYTKPRLTEFFSPIVFPLPP